MGRLWNDIKGSVSDQGKSNVLTQDQVNEIQRILLMILKDIDKVCRENNLRYVLIGGTAIGSIRHSGFIPWDDDIDIAMPRKDYEQFRKIIAAQFPEKYKLTDSIRNNNYGKVIPKLRLKGTIYRTLLDLEPTDVEIKSDIFIIENVADNAIVKNIQGFICMFMGLCLSCRRLATRKKFFAKVYKGKDFKIKTFVGSILSFASLEKWANWTECSYSMCKNDNSKFVTLPSDGLHFFKGIIRREVICQSVEGDFEGNRFFLPKEYDFYLRRIYGDYMEIPPKEKRMLSIYSELNYGKYEELAHTSKV